MKNVAPLLIVESHTGIAAMLECFFARQKVEVQTVTSVAKAQALLDKRPFEVVLTDLFLPHGDGLALSRHVRDVTPHTRVVVMGVFPSPEVEREAIKAGAYACIEKPFSLKVCGTSCTKPSRTPTQRPRTCMPHQ